MRKRRANFKKTFFIFFRKTLDNRSFFPILYIMNTKTYFASGLFETGTETATFDRTREGLESAYEFMSGAAAYVIKCGGEVVEEFDPWLEADIQEANRVTHG